MADLTRSVVSQRCSDVVCPTCGADVGTACRDLRNQAAWIGETERAQATKRPHKDRQRKSRARAGRAES